jgi:hypothetical protein
MFDEPQSGIYGGDISAPVFRNIARRYSLIPGGRMLVYSRPQPPSDSRVMVANSGGAAKVMKLAGRKPLRQTRDAKKQAGGGGFPDFTGQTIRDALRQARERGLTCRITGSGTVVAQVPPACLDTTGVVLVELIGEEQ